MKVTLTLAAILTLAVLCGCAQSDAKTHHNATTLAGKAETGFHLDGTLATLGSFEWDVAPLTTHAATQLHLTAVALKRGQMTRQRAQARMDAIDHAHDVLVQALKVCAQNGQGKCTGDEHQARLLLDAGRSALAALP